MVIDARKLVNDLVPVRAGGSIQGSGGRAAVIRVTLSPPGGAVLKNIGVIVAQ